MRGANSLLRLILAGIVVMFWCSMASAQVPGQMLYQGYLTDSVGEPLNGDYSMTFKIYLDEAGGSSIWDEDTGPVTVVEGLFEVVLGEINPIAPGIFDGTVLWLQTAVSGEVLLPRKPLVSSAYAFKAPGDNGGVTDHGDLTGLEDDDHTQYVLHSEVSSEAVTSLSKQGDIQLKGDVTLSEGTNVTIVQSGQDIQISASIDTPLEPDDVHSVHIKEADGTSEQDTNSGYGVKTDHIQDDAITAAKIAANAVGSPEIADNAVGSSEIATDAVTESEIADNAVGSTEISDGSVAQSDLGFTVVTSLSEIGSPQLAGDVTLSEGQNVTLTQVGQSIEIAAGGGGCANLECDETHSGYIMFSDEHTGTGDQDISLGTPGTIFIEGETDFFMKGYTETYGGVIYYPYGIEKIQGDVLPQYDDDGISIGSGSKRWSAIYAVSVVQGHTKEQINIEGIDEDGYVVIWEDRRLVMSHEPRDRRVFGVTDYEPPRERGAGSHRIVSYPEQCMPTISGVFVIRVAGAVNEGDLLVTSSVPGHAMADPDPLPGTVIAQALESFEGNSGLIKAMIRKF